MKTKKGFQLIELLIVISLISILTATGLSNYSNHLARAYRLEAEQSLLKAVTKLEQYELEHPFAPPPTLATLGQATEIAHANYSLSMQRDESSYRLTATPLDKQHELDSECGSLSIDSRGEKYISGNGKVLACWQA